MVFRFRGIPAGMVRKRNFLFLFCLIILATLLSGRLSTRCLYEGCNSDVTKAPVLQKNLDLSKIDAPFIRWPLERVCRETKWNPGVVFVCDNNSGGIGNIRNYILTCVRYGIEAGMTGLVLPQIRTRSAEDLSKIREPLRNFDYFFDEKHFRKRLMSACPQITVYNSTDDIPGAPKPFRAEVLTPRNLGQTGGCDPRDLNKHTDIFGKHFAAHLESTAVEFKLPPLSRAAPRIKRFTWGVQWDWPVYRDGPEFVATFGGLLRFRKDILALGKRTTAYMHQFATLQGRGAKASRFAGMHLRTENDALKNWPNFENQSTAYLERAASLDLRAAYIATGNKTEAEKLANAAGVQHGMGVVTKHDLLKDHPADMAALEELTWDQQALIDFIVLLESDYFLGVSPSSFSMNIAAKRHLKAEGLYTRPWKIGGDGDGRSWLVGNFEKYWVDWLFMYDSLWP